MQRIKQDIVGKYFDPCSNDEYRQSDSEGETLSSEGHLNERFNQETILFVGNDNAMPTEQDFSDPITRKRLE